MNGILISFDEKTQKFMIECPFWGNDLLGLIPNKRWSKARGVWAAPVTRMNVEGILETKARQNQEVEIGASARRAIEEYEKSTAKPIGVGFPPWYKFKLPPRKHQEAALEKGYKMKEFALFMDMQTGKSKTTIDLLSAHRMEGHIHGALILSKLSLRGNWAEQFGIHCPIPYSIHLPVTDKKREFSQWLSKDHDFKVMVVGWESLSVGGMKDMCKEFLRSLEKSGCAGDESTFIANHKSARSEEAVTIAKMADYRYILTGSPALEGPMNLFMQFEFLNTDIIGIGDFYAYRNRYAVMGGYTPKEGPMRGKPLEIVGYQNIDELMELIAPHTFQVTKDEAYDLPPKRYEVRTVGLTKEQKEAYTLVKKEGLLKIGGTDEELVLKNVLEVALRLHQITGGYSVSPRKEVKKKKDGTEVEKIIYDPVELVEPAKNPKMIELCSIVEEFKGRKQGIIWAVYRVEIEAIVELMKGMGLRVGELHGGIKEEDRQPMVRAFQAGELDIMVCNASTGGMGYTMMASEVNIFYNNTFKAVDRVQAEDRAYGDGQTKSGIWIDIVGEKTVDIIIREALKDKKDLSEYIRSRIRDVTKLLEGET